MKGFSNIVEKISSGGGGVEPITKGVSNTDGVELEFENELRVDKNILYVMPESKTVGDVKEAYRMIIVGLAIESYVLWGFNQSFSNNEQKTVDGISISTLYAFDIFDSNLESFIPNTTYYVYDITNLI